jgi:hypothetical protein
MVRRETKYGESEDFQKGKFRNFQNFLIIFMIFKEFLGISGTTTEIQEFFAACKTSNNLLTESENVHILYAWRSVSKVIAHNDSTTRGCTSGRSQNFKKL